MKPGQTATRTFLADSHLAAAFILGLQAKQIEQANPIRPSEEVRARHHAAVSGAVVLSAAFLEGFINELLAETEELTIHGLLSALSRPAYRRIADLWNEGIPRAGRYRICDKYQITLLVGDCAPFDKGAKQFQDAHLMCRLRNELVHLAPTWVIHSDEGGRDDHVMTKALHGLFAECPFAGPEDPWFPDRCLSAGCAAWAAESALTFVRGFVERFGVPGAGLWLKYRLPALAGVAVDPSESRWAAV